MTRRTLWAAWIVAAALPLAALAQAEGDKGYELNGKAFRVPLTVKENQGVERKGWPASFGVPLPAGLAAEPGQLRLLDSAGKPVPCQFEALSRYWGRDNSVRWALVEFQADVPANGSATYTLTNDGPGGQAGDGIAVNETADAITVATGPLAVEISKKRASLFESVRVGGRELVRAGAHDGPLAVVEAQDFERYWGGEWNMHGWESRKAAKQKPIRQADYYGDTAAPAEVVVERAGPLHAIVRVRGTYLCPDKGPDVLEQGVYNFTYRVHFFRGKDYVRVEHSVENSRFEQPEFQAKLLDHSLWTTLSLGGKTSCTFGGAGGKAGETALNGKPFATFNEKGDRIQWIDLKGADGRVGVAAPVVGGEWSFDVPGDRLAVRPYSIHFGREHPLSAIPPKSWGRGSFSLDFGSRKTYDVYYRFASADAAGSDLATLARGMTWPLFGFAPPAWYADSGVWNMELAAGYARPGRGSGAGAFDPYSADAGRLRRKADFNSGGHHGNLSSLYDGALMLGDLGAMQRDCWRTSFDIDFYQWNYRGHEPTTDPAALAKAHRMVLFGPKDFYIFAVAGINPGTHYNGYKYLPDFEHYAFLHLFEHYYLWGDRRARESLMRFANFAVTFEWDVMFKREGEKGIPPLTQTDFFDKHHAALWRSHYARIYAWQLYTPLQAFEATGNAVYDRLTRWQLRRLSRLQRLSRGVPEAWIRSYWDSAAQRSWKTVEYPTDDDVTTYQFKNQSWMYGKTMLAFHEAFKTYGDEEILDNIWGLADYYLEMPLSSDGKCLPNAPYIPKSLNEKPLPPHPHARTAQGLALAYYYTGDAGVKKLLDAHMAATREVKGGTWGHLTAWVAQRKTGRDRPPDAVTDLKCEKSARDGLTFSWTAPKAYSASGRAARYFLKFSTKPLVRHALVSNPDAPADPYLDRNKHTFKPECWHPDFLKTDAFWMATHVEGEPAPAAPGTKQTCTVTVVKPFDHYGLPLAQMPKVADLPAGTYYFAVCSYDEDRNLSDISNVVAVELK